MKAILHQIQRIFVGFLFAKELVHHGIERTDKEEMMSPFFSRYLERMFQSTLEQLNDHRRRHMEHLAAGRHLSIVTIIGELALNKCFSMINAARVFANRILHILGKQRLEPELARLIGEIAAEGHGLVAREKRRIALGANT